MATTIETNEPHHQRGDSLMTKRETLVILWDFNTFVGRVVRKCWELLRTDTASNDITNGLPLKDKDTKVDMNN